MPQETKKSESKFCSVIGKHLFEHVRTATGESICWALEQRSGRPTEQATGPPAVEAGETSVEKDRWYNQHAETTG